MLAHARGRLTYANLIASLALFVALGRTGRRLLTTPDGFLMAAHYRRHGLIPGADQAVPDSAWAVVTWAGGSHASTR